ncbi:hypothetical protein BDV24DRAFT_161264 [Aspergillus arachidicola]|uniref:Uncharacterized protein n=1 Tax=Aspergillus arachidicola TaxID=656916 RepID=A0A5N6YGL6_9EURO|nr:hypothetical protein BDV24DRAFT_161264 [Aspergillus arachidicola]
MSDSEQFEPRKRGPYAQSSLPSQYVCTTFQFLAFGNSYVAESQAQTIVAKFWESTAGRWDKLRSTTTMHFRNIVSLFHDVGQRMQPPEIRKDRQSQYGLPKIYDSSLLPWVNYDITPATSVRALVYVYLRVLRVDHHAGYAYMLLWHCPVLEPRLRTAENDAYCSKYTYQNQSDIPLHCIDQTLQARFAIAISAASQFKPNPFGNIDLQYYMF